MTDNDTLCSFTKWAKTRVDVLYEDSPSCQIVSNLGYTAVYQNQL